MNFPSASMAKVRKSLALATGLGISNLTQSAQNSINFSIWKIKYGFNKVINIKSTCESKKNCRFPLIFWLNKVLYKVNTEKAMAPHSSTPAWKIPWMEEPGRLQSMGSLRVGHNWATSFSLFTFHFHALEKEMATHSDVLAWRIPGMGEPGGLLSI